MAAKTEFAKLFQALPEELSVELEKQYSLIKKNFIEGRFEPAELDAAKLCEVIFRILEWHTESNKKYVPLGQSIKPDFSTACRQFENMSSFQDSVRFHIPKLMVFLYSMRNKRGVGHLGGDVSPNHMDSTVIMHCSDWMLAELVRIFHNLTTTKAQKIVEGLIEKKIPLVWEVNNKCRILSEKMDYPEKTLVLLHKQYPGNLPEEILFEWTEHSNSSVYRKDVLYVLHKKKLVEYDKTKRTVTLSPKGVNMVETEILPTYT